MDKARLLSTVAATLLLVGAASAQDMKKDEAPGRAPAAQQNAPAEKVAPAQKGAPALRSERKTPETTGQAPKEPEGNQMNAPKGKDTQMKKGAQTEKAEPHGAVKGSADMKGKDEHNASENRTAPTGKSAAEQKQTTTGQGAAGGRANLSSEQRTKITTVFKEHRVTPVHLNVSIRVGTRIPGSVHFYPIPQDVVVIYPEWRGYDYILVGDQILIIDPGSHEIVAILDA